MQPGRGVAAFTRWPFSSGESVLFSQWSQELSAPKTDKLSYFEWTGSCHCYYNYIWV